MADFTVLTINPGSTGTKVGLVRAGEIKLDLNVDNAPGEFDGFSSFGEQVPLRIEKIMAMLEENNVDLASIDAVSGRGVGIHPCAGGTYRINQKAYEDALHDVEGINHPATLGIVISAEIGKKLGKPSFFVNPMCTDELAPVARMTGVHGLYRPSHSHPLNMKQVGIHHAKLQGTRYEDCNFVICHMGGGTSVAAHNHGKMVDTTRIGDGQGPISPNRAGDICYDDVATLMKRGLTFEEVGQLVSRKGGFKNICGTDDLREVTGKLIPEGNEEAKLAYEAMEYTIRKWSACMAGALAGEVDAVLLTGGLAHDKNLVENLTKHLSWIAPVFAYPGSFETEALGAGAERVLAGEEEAKRYTGEPVWEGFGD